jgi:Protein of unknown function (DUF1217)
MAGNFNLSGPSYLPTLYGSVSGGDSLLATLYGQGAKTPNATNPIAALVQAQTGEPRQVALVAAEPAVKRDLQQFTAALAKAKTPADLLANPAALKVLLTANGLGDQTAYTALATRALLSDPSQPKAVVNHLTDTRWAAVNKLYAFATKGLSILKNPASISAITNGYAEVLWRKNLDQTTPGLSNALDFQKRAATITSTDQVLGDPTFRDVITTALGIPKQIAFQTLTAQESAIATRIDLKKFKDPSFVRHFTQQYLIAKAQNASQDSSTASNDLTTLAARSAGLVV